jgi:hypothetical protein
MKAETLDVLASMALIATVAAILWVIGYVGGV